MITSVTELSGVREAMRTGAQDYVFKDELSPEMLDYLTVIDGQSHFAILACTDSLDLKKEEGVGIARFVRFKVGEVSGASAGPETAAAPVSA